ncbi:hypothetical protein Emed_007288 [Eimeria media]
MACCLCGPSGGGCCCGGCGGCGGYDEAELLRQQQRQQLLETVRRMKGLSRNSRARLPLDPLAVVEDARTRMHAKEASVCCLSKPRSCTWPLLLWLCVYGVALSSLQMKLIDLRQVAPSWMLETDTLSLFSTIFSWAVLVMMAVMSAAFAAAAMRVCSFISSMTAEVVTAAQEELRLDISESVDHDFHSFVRRLREQFITGEDFTVAAIKGAHRRLHALLKARTSLVGVYVQGPLAVGREVETAVAPLRCCILFFLFFLPWIFTMCLNLAQLYLLSAAFTTKPQEPLESLSPTEEGVPLGRETPGNDEALTLIVANVIVNLLATAFLACAQTRCVEDCFASCFFSRIHAAVVNFCNRLITRTWDEAVICELVELLEGPRMGMERHSEDNLLSGGDADDHYPHPLTAAAAAAAGSFDQQQQQQQQQQRLLTGDSCGGLPTAYQAALQAPSVPPRSKSRSQCLALAPSSLWHDVEIGLKRFGGVGEEYIELEALDDFLPLDHQKLTSADAKIQEEDESIAMPTPTTAATQPATTAAAATAAGAAAAAEAAAAAAGERETEREERIRCDSSESSSS